ncbi:hypothetical protein L1987_33522 [Smallanthus sonchifolius]|uniref:Uncharacterized protein n=1 Tax=Smallanthus sonchifolius TaxID=185202 RepID=A0ACB9HSQ0_9ASTR|nr:hypothetical protein L1987_33522 [Smallanthus sonchifolius]
MSAVFIAVQCSHCSTMQASIVKQRKKSSNKWTCVVCNEKQSVRKVFSQAFMAEDVRKFVQSFNMSRQFIEQQQEETLTKNQPNNKRTDWTEYVDPDINDVGIGDDEGELCEPNVVTELPKPIFKKPKLRNNYSAAGLDGEKLSRPVFGKKKFDNSGTVVKGNFKRVDDNQHNHDTVDCCSVYGRSNSKWNDCDDAGSSSLTLKLKRPVSKWNNFIDDDADDESRCEEINHAAFETKVSDEIVEDDVHLDFI